MQNEENNKMKTQATSVVLNFVQGLITETDAADEEEIDGR